MPEGDTVFHTATRLRAALRGSVLRYAQLRHPRLSTMELAGRTVSGVRSVGKHLFLRFDDELSLHHHLMMDGGWHLNPVGTRWRKPAHQARVVLRTDEVEAVGFLLHELRVIRVQDEDKLVDHLGPDLLDEAWDDTLAATAAARLAAEPDRPLGEALLDQRVLAGIGNVYKSELCFLLGVTPWAPVSEVDTAEAVRLSHDLLFRNRDRYDRNTTGQRGRGRGTWVYGRSKRAQGCLRCGGPVRIAEQGEALRERVTYWCPRCQTGPGPVQHQSRPHG